MALAAASRLRTYASFVKLEHTLFSLPLIYAGAIVGAGGWPSPRLFGWILSAAIGGRVAAMGLNRLLDAEIDRRNPRTQRRELPSGAMQRWEGWLVVALGMLVYVASAAALGPLCLRLSPIPVALFAVYPLLKRFTWWCHAGLGLAWSMGPLGGWIVGAQSLAHLDRAASLWLFSLLWVTGFDVIYATMDEAFDRAEGIYSVPSRFGRARALKIAAVLHGMAFGSLMTFWRESSQSVAGLIALAVVAALFIWQHIVADKHTEFAFFQLNAAQGLAVFLFTVIAIA